MTETQREHYIKIYRGSLVVCGAVTIGLAGAHLINQPLDLRWLALAAFAVVGSWLAASQIPGAKSIVTVSDTFIFLTMLLCGPDAVTLVAAAAAVSESARHVKRWLTLATNISVICCSFFIASWLVTFIFGDLRLLAHHKETFFVYALALGVFAALQAVVNALLVMVVITLKTGKPILQTWRDGYSWVMVTSFLRRHHGRHRQCADPLLWLYRCWLHDSGAAGELSGLPPLPQEHRRRAPTCGGDTGAAYADARSLRHRRGRQRPDHARARSARPGLRRRRRAIARFIGKRDRSLARRSLAPRHRQARRCPITFSTNQDV